MNKDIESLGVGSLACPHCNNNHPASDWCRCEGAVTQRSETLTELLFQLKINETSSATWEYFQDHSYYGMFCVRPKGNKTFGVGFHLVNENEASGLCDLLNGMRTVITTEPHSLEIEPILERLREIHRRNPSEYDEVCSIIDVIRRRNP